MKIKTIRMRNKVILPLLISFIIGFPLTYFLADIDNNVIDRTFNTTNMLAFIGFTLALYFFVNDTVIKLKVRMCSSNRKKEEIESLIGKIEECHKEISDNLLFLFFMMIAIFVTEIFSDIFMNSHFSLNIWYGVLTIKSGMFFFRCVATQLSLYVIYDVFGASMKLSKISIDKCIN